MFHRILLKSGVLVLSATFILIMHVVWPTQLGKGLALPRNSFVLTSVALAMLLLFGAFILERRPSRVVKLTATSTMLAFVVLADVLIYFFQIIAGKDAVFPLHRVGLVISGIFFVSCVSELICRKKIDYTAVLFLIVLAAVIQSALSLSFFLWFALQSGTITLVLPELLFGVFEQPNISSSFAVTAIAVAIVMRMDCSCLSKAHVRWIYFSLVMLSVTVVIWQSKTGWLGLLIVSLITVGVMLKGKQELKSKLCYSLLFIIIGIFIGSGLLLVSEEMRRDISFVVDSSGNLRTQQWYLVYRLFSESPLLGVGLGKFENAFAIMQAKWFAAGSGFLITDLTHPHNELLYWIAEGGLLGGLGLLCPILYVLQKWSRIALKNSRFIYISMLVPIALHSLTEYPLYNSIPHWITILLLCSVIDFKFNIEQTNLIFRDSVFNYFGLFFFLVLFFYSLYSFMFSMHFDRIAQEPVDERVGIYRLDIMPHAFERTYKGQYLSDLLRSSLKRDSSVPVNETLLLVDDYLDSYTDLELYDLSINLCQSYQMTECYLRWKKQKEFYFPSGWEPNKKYEFKWVF